MKTYVIGADPNGQTYILCKICNLRSYNIDDIKHKFCGNCHIWHQE